MGEISKLRYGGAILGEPHVDSVTDALHHECCRAASRQFAANVARSEAMLRMIPSAVQLATISESLAMRADFQAFKTIHPLAAGLLDEAGMERQRQERSKVLEEFRREVDADPQWDASQLERGVSLLEQMIEVHTPDQPEHELVTGVRAVLDNAAIGTWTAFETLAGDLWVSVVNAFPSHLATLVGTATRIQVATWGTARRGSDDGDAGAGGVGADDADDDLCDSSEKTIALGVLRSFTKGSYNPGNRMGDLLVAADRVRFTSLRRIRAAYSLAFSEKFRRARPTRIDAALSDKGLDALSLTRNLLVHKAGHADASYIRDAADVPLAHKLSLNQRLDLDGPKLRALMNPAIIQGVSLLKAVDSWLKTSQRNRS